MPPTVRSRGRRVRARHPTALEETPKHAQSTSISYPLLKDRLRYGQHNSGPTKAITDLHWTLTVCWAAYDSTRYMGVRWCRSQPANPPALSCLFPVPRGK